MILAVCKDPGGMAGIVRVVKDLRQKNTVALIGNGKAAELLPNEGIEFEVFETAKQVLASHPNPRLLLTSMCSEGGVGRNLVPLLKNICPTISVQDYWGTRLVDSWQDSQYRPDYICVNDQICADLVLKAWSDFNQDRIKITGFPMLDQYAGANINKAETRKNVAEKLGLDKDWPIIALPVGIFHGASLTMSEVGQAIKKTRRNFYFIPRYHPRMAQNAPQELDLWTQALANYNQSGLVADSSACKTQEILKASDLVISEFSTSLLEASVLRIPNISVFYLEEARELFHKEFGDLMSEPPFVTLGLTYSARDTENLTELIIHAIDKGPRNPQVEKEFIQKYVDGKNVRRIAEFVDSLI